MIVSSIRVGMKREFTLMMKAQSEMAELPTGRRRVSNSQSDGNSTKGRDNKNDKRTKQTKSKQMKKEKTEKQGHEEEKNIVDKEVVGTSQSKFVTKVCNKVALTKIPTKLKDLLQTGLLEGLHIRYVHGSKGKKRQESELHGIIQGTGILCSCDECHGIKVVSPNQFEIHAGSGNKRPPEYIYLNNGRSLRDVLNASKVDSIDSLQLAILNAIGQIENTNTSSGNPEGLIPEILQKEIDSSHTQINETIPRYDALARSSGHASSSCQPESVEISSDLQPQPKRKGKLTRKDLRMHKSVLSHDVLPDGTALSYVIHGKIWLEGVKKDGGILCNHCGEVVSPSVFEAHANFASRRKPYMSIYTSNGVSLHELSLELSRNRESSSKDSDDLCSICKDGGDLINCKNCPRAFHTECIDLSSIPQGTWYCRYCKNLFEKEKFAERDANAIAAGRVPGVDPLKDITQRCIRVVEAFEDDLTRCNICRCHDFTKAGFDGRTIIICDQCEKEYHVSCLKENNIDDLKALPEEDWFCCKQCNNINSALEKLTEDGEQRLPETILDNLRKKLNIDKLQIRWRLLRGKNASKDIRVWLSSAVAIFHDQFDPIVAGSLDLIPHMVYGRSFKDQDFCGMYCALLMVNSIVVSAAIFRIFGEEVAELPLVATKSDNQGKGYFQLLFFCIEGLLSSLGVKDLVLPAATVANSLWRHKMGFEELEQEQLERYKNSYQMMIFQGTSILHKRVPTKL